MRIPSFLIDVLQLFNSAGFKAYLVGGYVRDHLLGIETDDFDIVTNASISDVEKIFESCGAISKKSDFFLNIKLSYKGHSFDITSMRKEGEYTKPGYPSGITTTDSIQEDLKRRDFTINAIAYSLDEGIVDPYNGQNDIKSKIIRSIKNPSLSYKEDPTRIIRAYRFADKLGFSINNSDQAAINDNKYLLKELSKHQKEKELAKIKSESSPALYNFILSLF